MKTNGAFRRFHSVFREWDLAISQLRIPAAISVATNSPVRDLVLRFGAVPRYRDYVAANTRRPQLRVYCPYAIMKKFLENQRLIYIASKSDHTQFIIDSESESEIILLSRVSLANMMTSNDVSINNTSFDVTLLLGHI